jgi:hypothetical protein
MYNEGMAIRRRFRLIAGGLVAAALAAGCKTTSSTDLMTGEISADIRVSATSAIASSVRVRMSPGSVVVPTDVVNLTGGDALFAEAGGQRKQMSAGNRDYETSFATGAAETPFRIILDRARPDQVDAPESAGTLPAPFNLNDLGGAEISQAQDVVLTWSPSGTLDRMMLDIQGSCVEDRTISINADPGDYTLTTTTLEPETIPSSCLVTLTLHRVRTGVADPNLNPGSAFFLEQVRTTTFHSHR